MSDYRIITGSDQNEDHDVSFMHGASNNRQIDFREVKRFDGRFTPKKRKRRKKK